MSFGARCGFFVLLAGLATAVTAQDRPARAWKDPPGRESGSSEAKAAEPAKSEQGSVTPAAGGEAASPARKVRRSAGLSRRQAHARYARSWRAAHASPSPERMTSRRRARPHAVAVSRFGPDAEDGYEPVPRHPLARFRREGWGNLISARRARRLVEADERRAPFGFLSGRPGYMSGPDEEDATE